MTQDSLARALGGLKGARMDDVAADDIRKRLDSAWAERAHRRPRSRFALPGFARAFAVAALVVIVAFSTMRAAADSPLYGARVAVEDSLVAFQSDPVGCLSLQRARRSRCLRQARHLRRPRRRPNRRRLCPPPPSRRSSAPRRPSPRL